MFDDELDAPAQLKRVLYSRVFKFNPQGSLSERDDEVTCLSCEGHMHKLYVEMYMIGVQIKFEGKCKYRVLSLKP